MKVYCVFSLELPHGGDSNEYIQCIVFNIKKSPKIIPDLQLCDFSKRLKNDIEIAEIALLS